MSVDVELTSDEQEALAGYSAPGWCCVFDTAAGPNVVATARVNGTPSYPLKTLAVDGVSAGWADVAPGMAILIGSTAGSFNRGIYRVTDTGTSVTLEMMAIGLNDSGSVAMATRSAGITDNDYATILRRLDLFGVYARIDYHEGLEADIYEDWNKPYTNLNEFPPPQVNVFIAGRAEHYGNYVGDETEDTFDIDLEITLWPTSSDADWEIVLPGALTLNSGSLTGSGLSASINVTAPHSPDPFTVDFIVTEDNGNTFTAERKIWITSSAYPPLPVTIQTHDDDLGGCRRTITVTSLTGFVPGALVHLFYKGTWNGVDVPSAIHAFTGYVVSASESTIPGLAGVTLNLIGPSLMLDLIGGQSQIWSATASPANWQQIVPDMSYLDGVIWLYLYQRVAGLLQMFNCTLFGLPNTQKRMPAWRIDGGSLLSQVQALVKRYCGGNFGADPGGELMFRVKPSRVWDRSGLDTRCELDASIYKTVDLGAESRPTLRRLRGETFYGDTSSVTPVWSDAPEIPGQGTSEEKIDRLVVESPTELYQVTGLEYAARNNKYKSGSILIEKYYGVIRPAQLLRVWLEIPAALRYDGQAWEGYILPTKVSYSHNPDGTMNTVIGFEAETTGTIGVDAPIPVPDPTKFNSRYQARPFAPIPMARAIARRNGNINPAGTKEGARVIPKDGSVVFCGTATQAFVGTNFIGTPQYRNVTPPSLGDFEIKHGMVEIGGTRAWLLVSDGTDSKVHRTANIFATPRPTWTASDDVSGVYTLVRQANTTGGILIYSPFASGGGGGGTWSVEYDFATGTHGWAPYFDGGFFGVYGGGVWTSQDDSFSRPVLRLQVPWGISTTVTKVTYHGTVGANGAVMVTQVAGNGGHSSPGQTAGALAPYVQNMSSANVGNGLAVDFSTNTAFAADNTLSKIVAEGTGDVPDGDVTAIYSADGGENWGTVRSLGSTPGSVGGFDVQRGGTVSYGASLEQVQKATTLGGTYSAATGGDGLSATLIETPWYTRNSNSALNSGSSPEFIFGTPSVDGSDNALFWVVGGTAQDITPVVSGNPGVFESANALATWKGKYVAAVLSFGGTIRVVTSIDGGTTWKDRGTAEGASYIRVRRLAKTPGQLYIAGGNFPQYSPNFGLTRVDKARPSSAALVFIEPVG